MDESTDEDRALWNSQCLPSGCQAFTLVPWGGNSSYLNDNTCSVNFQASINLMLTRGIIKYEHKGIAIHKENSTTGLIFQQILETVIWDFVQFF